MDLQEFKNEHQVTFSGTGFILPPLAITKNGNVSSACKINRALTAVQSQPFPYCCGFTTMYNLFGVEFYQTQYDEILGIKTEKVPPNIRQELLVETLKVNTSSNGHNYIYVISPSNIRLGYLDIFEKAGWQLLENTLCNNVVHNSTLMLAVKLAKPREHEQTKFLRDFFATKVTPAVPTKPKTKRTADVKVHSL